MTKKETTTTALNELQALQIRFSHWRDSENRSRTIPEELWNEATALYPRLSVNKIRTSLRLNYSSLTQRIGLKEKRRGQGEADFIEVLMKTPPSRNVEVTGIKVEMRDGSGREMKVHLPEVSPGALDVVIQAFWSKN